MRFSGYFALAALACFASLTTAQQQPNRQQQQQQQQQPASARAGDPPAAPRQMNNEDARSASQAMQRNGGSLLKATLATPVDPAQAQLSNVSYFSVPEPEPRVIKKHDQITIIIREESEFSSDGKTETKKDAKLDARVEEFLKLNLENWQLTGDGIGSSPPAISAAANREFTGEGTVDRVDSFIARVTARVIDVKPNGTLVLEGRKQITTDDEYQRFLVTGTARAEDVTADNTVLSTQLADFNLRKTHKGDVRNAQKKGLIPKLVDWINPF